MKNFNAEGFAQCISTMAHTEAIKGQHEVVEALEKQKTLEWTIGVSASKIAQFEKLLKAERENLTKTATEAAKNREKLVGLLFNVVQKNKK